MKVFVTLAFLAAVVYAEPPSFRQQQQNRYFFARQQEETTASGPYAPSGWKPDGPAFNLPQRQQKQQQVENAYGPSLQTQQQYGAPQAPQQQGPTQQPQQQYGAPATLRASITRQNLPTLKIQAFARQQQQQPQYGAPQEPQQQQQYGATLEPQKQQQQYGAPLEPQKQQQQYGAPLEPQQQYGAPQQAQQQYGASQQPQEQYGASQQNPAPEFPTTEFPSVTEVDEPTTDSGLSESESEQVKSTNEFEDDADLDEQSQKSQQQQQDRGEYYVALPDGRLQRVRYVSRQDLEAMRYFAKIRAENVEPLRGPIYAYAPLQKLQVAPGNLQVAVSAAPAVPTVSITAPEERPQKLVQSPKVDIKPLAQVQIQHDTPAQVVPLSSSYTTYTANYQVPEDRYILAFP